MSSSLSTGVLPTKPELWKQAMNELPDVPEGGKIPAFYFAHGQPMLVWPPSIPSDPRFASVGPKSDLAAFLKDFGPFLLKKYKPKGIVVFSAHWETMRERLVTDYGDENPLLMDYFGFPSELYKIKFKSRGDSDLSNKVVQEFKKAGIPARTSPITEARGRDGRGHTGPGFDHGVFVPFKLMFGEELRDVPIVEVSIHESLDADKNWEVGKALDGLRSEGYLILSGGLTIHSFEDFDAFFEKSAKPEFHVWNKAVMDAVQIESPEERRKAMIALTSHKTYRKAHPRAEHFVPLYVAAGAGEGKSKLISGLYGSPTVAFGI